MYYIYMYMDIYICIYLYIYIYVYSNYIMYAGFLEIPMIWGIMANPFPR